MKLFTLMIILCFDNSGADCHLYQAEQFYTQEACQEAAKEYTGADLVWCQDAYEANTEGREA